jgi:hypothetical protein
MLKHQKGDKENYIKTGCMNLVCLGGYNRHRVVLTDGFGISGLEFSPLYKLHTTSSYNVHACKLTL